MGPVSYTHLALVAVGASLGLLLADGGMKVLQGLISKDMMIGMPYLRGLSLNADVLVFAGCLALLRCV